MYRQSEKLVKQQYVLHTSPEYGNFIPLTAEIGSGAWGTPANFNGFRVLLSLLQRGRSPEAITKLCTMLGRLLGWYTIYTFSGAVAP